MPFYKYHLFFCTNQRPKGEACCQQFDAFSARNHVKERLKASGLHGPGGIRVNTAGCLGRCDQGPVILIYPDEVWYTYIDREDLDEIIREHLLQGRPVERLLLPG